MALALFWIAALICTIVATAGAIASAEPTPAALPRDGGEREPAPESR